MNLLDWLNSEEDRDPAFVKLFRGALSASMAAAFLIAAVVVFFSRLYLVAALVFAAGALFGFSLLLSYRGVFWLGKVALPLATLLAAAYASVKGNGMHDTAVFGFGLVVLFAALLIGQKAIPWAALLVLLGIGFVAYADVSGLNRSSIAYKTGWDDVLIVGAFQAVTAFALYALMNRLNQALQSACRSESALRENNRELDSLRAALEAKAMERARAAEAASAQVEAQAWAARGQAQLAERMRGDLELDDLANNIAAYLCRYVGAQAAALFVSYEGALKLMGGFALQDQSGLRRSFRLGEGWVGEAALLRQTMRLSELPPDAPLVVSGLGESPPREILLVPFESNGQVFGVLELLSFSRFTAAQEEFLKQVSESAAIALRSALTRKQMNELLSKL